MMREHKTASITEVRQNAATHGYEGGKQSGSEEEDVDAATPNHPPRHDKTDFEFAYLRDPASHGEIRQKRIITRKGDVTRVCLPKNRYCQVLC